MPILPLKPFWQTQDHETVRLYQGHVIDVLQRLPARSVHCVVTSPPYFGLRVYADARSVAFPDVTFRPTSDSPPITVPGGLRSFGSEATTAEYVADTVHILRELRRVLRDDGTIWWNLGDTYASGEVGRHDQKAGQYLTGGNAVKGSGGAREYFRPDTNLPQGNLLGIPWRVALALQADGWVLRQDIIWSKVSPMPESVTNRCTKSHEYIFLLTKSNRYYCDMEAIKEPSEDKHQRTLSEAVLVKDSRAWEVENGRIVPNPAKGKEYGCYASGRNKRSVWHLASSGYPGAHYATFTTKLIEPCILAGTSEHGCCVRCGCPWRRVTERVALKRERPNEYVKYADRRFHGGQKGTPPGQNPQQDGRGTVNSCANTVAGVQVRTVGWEPGCECHGRFVKKTRQVDRQPAISAPGWAGSSKVAPPIAGLSETVEETVEVYESDLPLDEHPISPCIVLDPFIGSGTTSVVSLQRGQHSWGIDLSSKYLTDNAIPRIEGYIRSIPAYSHLLPSPPPAPVIGRSLPLRRPSDSVSR